MGFGIREQPKIRKVYPHRDVERLELNPGPPKEAPPTMEKEELEAELARLRAENETLKESKAGALRLQVSAKGAASLYGIRRFPITFYKEEWNTILGMAEDIKTFLAEHDAELTTKAAKGSKA